MRLNTLIAVVVALLAAASLARSEPKLTAARAAALAQERYFGDVIDIDIDEADPREPHGPVYDVKLLTGTGDVIKVRIAAESGDYLGADGPDLARALKPLARKNTP